MTLTYKLELDNLPLDLHVKIQVCMYVRLAGRVRRTHTDTRTDYAKTITPITSETFGVTKGQRPTWPKTSTQTSTKTPQDPRMTLEDRLRSWHRIGRVGTLTPLALCL